MDRMHGLMDNMRPGSGRPPMGHRRSRSIESSGSVLSDPGEAFRAELERIGSGTAASSVGRASSEGEAGQVPAAAAPGGPGLGSGLAPGPMPGPAAANGSRAAQGPGAPLGMTVKTLKPHPNLSEAELISWDELEAKRDVYHAVTTPDGLQALIRSPSGAPAIYRGTNEGFKFRVGERSGNAACAGVGEGAWRSDCSRLAPSVGTGLAHRVALAAHAPWRRLTMGCNARRLVCAELVVAGPKALQLHCLRLRQCPCVGFKRCPMVRRAPAVACRPI